MDGFKRSLTSGIKDHGNLHAEVDAAGVNMTSNTKVVPVVKANVNPVTKVTFVPVAKAAALSHKGNL